MKNNINVIGQKLDTHYFYISIKNFLLDLILIFIPFGLIALISILFSYNTKYYFYTNTILALFILPGWLITRHIHNKNDDLISTYLLASFISFVIYSNLAFISSLLSLSFDEFYLIYLSIILIVTLYSFKTYRQLNRPLPPFRLTKSIILLLSIVLIILFYRYPYANDAGQFIGPQLDYFFNRTFEVSTYGAENFGFDEAMPRWHTYFFHIFQSILADLMRIPPYVVTIALIPIPFGILFFVALFCFIRSITGNNTPPFLILFAILIPITLFYSGYGYSPYDFTFRLLNSPAVDKDFCLMYVLPSILYISVLFIHRKEPIYFYILLFSSFITIYFHPFTSIYYLMSIIVILFGFRKLSKESIMIFILSIGWFLINLLMGFGQTSHKEIDFIVKHSLDLNNNQLVYWGGHYASIKEMSHYSATIIWIKDCMLLNANYLIKSNSLLYTSFIATIIWIILFLLKKWVFHKKIPINEKIALSIQINYIIVIFLIILTSPIFFYFYPYYFRGYERLHWMYLGFFSFVFINIYILSYFNYIISFKWGRIISAIFLFLFSLHLLDQIGALAFKQHNAITDKLPYFRSIVDTPYKSFLFQREKQVKSLLSYLVNPLPSYLVKKPIWLKKSDKVLTFLSPAMFNSYFMQKQSVYWKELYGEGYAYSKLGKSFLNDYDAYYDFYFLRPTDRLVQWLKRKGVTILVLNNYEPPQKVSGFIKKLRDKMDKPFIKIDKFTYHIINNKEKLSKTTS